MYTQGVAAVDTLLANLPDLDGQPTLSKMMRKVSRYYTGFRIAHAGGVFTAWRFIYHGVAIVPSWGDNPLAAATLEAAIEYASIDMAVLAPVDVTGGCKFTHVPGEDEETEVHQSGWR